MRMRSLFAHERTAVNANSFLDGVLSSELRKTGWMRGEVAGDPGPVAAASAAGTGSMGCDALRDLLRDYVVEYLADDDAVLVVGETQLPTDGD